MRLIIKHPRCLLLCVLLVLPGIPSSESVIIAKQAKVRNDTVEMLFVAKALSGSPQSAVLDVATLTDWALSYQDSYPKVMMLQATPQKSQYYDAQKRLIEWSASQQIKIKSRDLESIHALTSLLLDRLEPMRVQFLLSEKERAKTEKFLLDKVIEHYENRPAYSASKPHYMRITANNLANEASLLMSKTLLEARSLDTSFEPGFSIIKVELIGIPPH